MGGRYNPFNHLILIIFSVFSVVKFDNTLMGKKGFTLIEVMVAIATITSMRVNPFFPINVLSNLTTENTEKMINIKWLNGL